MLGKKNGVLDNLLSSQNLMLQSKRYIEWNNHFDQIFDPLRQILSWYISFFFKTV